MAPLPERSARSPSRRAERRSATFLVHAGVVVDYNTRLPYTTRRVSQPFPLRRRLNGIPKGTGMTNIYLRAALVALALFVSSCARDGVAADATAQEKEAKEKAAAAIPVEVAQPIRGEMLAMYSGTATLEAEADAEIKAKVGGEVRRILVEEGDRVKAGQVLAMLDDRQLRLQAAQTRAALAKTERDFNRQIELNKKGLVS